MQSTIKKLPKLPRIGSLAYKRPLFAQILGHRESKCEAGGDGVNRLEALGVVVTQWIPRRSLQRIIPDSIDWATPMLRTLPS